MIIHVLTFTFHFLFSAALVIAGHRQHFFAAFSSTHLSNCLLSLHIDRQMDGLNANYSFSDMDTIDYIMANSDDLDGVEHEVCCASWRLPFALY